MKKTRLLGRNFRMPGALYVAMVVTVACMALAARNGEAAEVAALPAPLPECIACHGENGVGISEDIPSLGGQHENYLNERLHRFYRPDSGAVVMQEIVAKLDEQQIRTAVDYFSRLPYLRKMQTVDAEKAERGKQVYVRLCQLCHADEGRAAPYAEYPLLAGQKLAYLQKTMADILAGRRKIDVVKENFLSLLAESPGRIDDALHFFASQQVDPGQMMRPAEEVKKKRRRHFPPQ